MGRYRYQIFDTVDTGLRCDGIDTRKQYRSVSIPARAALRMRKVYVFTRSRENQWCHQVVTAVVTGSSSQISSIKHVLRHVDIFLFLKENLWVVYLSVCMCMLSTCLSCNDASLLFSIGIEKSIVSTVSKVKYSVSYRTEKTWYRPPLVRNSEVRVQTISTCHGHYVMGIRSCELSEPRKRMAGYPLFAHARNYLSQDGWGGAYDVPNPRARWSDVGTRIELN